MDKRVVGIWYSWGDNEAPVEIPEGKNEWKYMKELAFKESLIEEVENEYGVDIYTYPDEEKIILVYRRDNEYCYYKIFESEEEYYNFIDNNKQAINNLKIVLSEVNQCLDMSSAIE